MESQSQQKVYNGDWKTASYPGIDKILAGVGEKVPVPMTASGMVMIRMSVVAIQRRLSGVNVQAVLAFFREAEAEDDLVPFYLMRDALLQAIVI